MKKFIILLIFLMLIPLVYSNQTLSIEQTTNFNDREVKIIGIEESKVLVSVDGVKNIVSINQPKTINGIEIIVTEIFYAGSLSTTILDLDLTYSCGDNSCDVGETSSNCCLDCGCNPATTDQCSNNECIIPECSSDINCNDNNPLTTDSCSDFKCKYRKIKCTEDLDCNDSNPDTDDTCNRGNCINILNYVCKEDIDCDDNNPCTTDSCSNRDCINTPKEDCEFTPEEEEEEKEIERVMEEISEESKKQSFLIRLFNWLRNIL